MSYTAEDLGKNMWKLTIESTAEEFEAALQTSYLKNRGKINVQGFRKGKAPRSLIEKMYGVGVFYEDAANALIPDAYEKALKESGLDIVSQPEIDVTQIEKGKPFIFTAEVAVKPEAKLGKYLGVEVEAEKIEVQDNEVEAELKRVQEQNARTITIDDRPVEDGDTVDIDYEGRVDGELFDGGAAEGHQLVIGSHSFIDNFEEQIIGKNAGEELDVNVTFPEEYHAEELKGKPAVFHVKVNEIKKKELPELDDDFAQDVSEFDTLDEYKADIRANITERKSKEARGHKEDATVEAIIKGAEMDIPAPMVEATKKQMAEEFAMRMQSQGLPFEQYLKYTGMDAKQFMSQMEPQALKRIQYRTVLEAVVKAEGITASDEEMEEEFKSMAEQYKTDIDKLKEMVKEEDKKLMMMDIAVRKAIDLVTDAAVEVEKAEKKEEEA